MRGAIGERPPRLRQLARARRSALIVLAETLMTWIERARSRRVLGSLDDRMLSDIGMDRGDVQSEIAKPFWRR